MGGSLEGQEGQQEVLQVYSNDKIDISLHEFIDDNGIGKDEGKMKMLFLEF